MTAERTAARVLLTLAPLLLPLYERSDLFDSEFEKNLSTGTQVLPLPFSLGITGPSAFGSCYGTRFSQPNSSTGNTEWGEKQPLLLSIGWFSFHLVPCWGRDHAGQCSKGCGDRAPGRFIRILVLSPVAGQVFGKSLWVSVLCSAT